MTLTIFHVKLKSCTHAIRENLNDLREKLTTQKVFLTEKRQLVRHKKRLECITCGHPDMHAVIDFQVTE